MIIWRDTCFIISTHFVGIYCCYILILVFSATNNNYTNKRNMLFQEELFSFSVYEVQLDSDKMK